MVFDPLMALSTCLTYFFQLTFVYLVIWGLCSLTRAPRIRARLWGGFLLLGVAYWVGRCMAVAGVFSHPAARVGPVETASTMGWTWAVAPSHAPRLIGVPAWTVLIYLALVAIFLVHLLAKTWILRQFLATGHQASEELNQLFSELCSEMEVYGCELVLVPGLRSPATANWWHPRVLLPAELVPELQSPQLANILRHELIHIRRRDYLWDRLAALACRIVFFHPVMWMAHRRLRWERELACDEAVVRQCGDERIQYAECLTTLARWWFAVEKNSRGAIGFASSASLLGTRVRALLHEPVRYNPFQRASRAGLVLLMLTAAAASLPGMRLTLYWGAPEGFSAAEASPGEPLAHRARLTRQHKSPTPARILAAENSAGLAARSVLPSVPAALSLIEKPAMPVYSGARNYEPASDYSASDSTVADSTTTGAWNESGGGAAPRAKQGPNWRDTAIGAITTGIAIIRSHDDDGPSVGGRPRSGEGVEHILSGSPKQ